MFSQGQRQPHYARLNATPMPDAKAPPLFRLFLCARAEAPVDFSTFYPMFQAVCRMREQLTPVEKANFSQEGLVAGFRVFDRDDSGLIHSSELRRLLTCIGAHSHTFRFSSTPTCTELLIRYSCSSLEGDRMTEDEVELLLAGHTDQDGNVNYDGMLKSTVPATLLHFPTSSL